MKYFFLVGLAAAVQNKDENECKGHQSCWSAIEAKYQEPWPACVSDSDCAHDHYCLNFIWSYNEQEESARGCWKRRICSGNGSYAVFEDRPMQWFCSEEQLAANQGEEPPFIGMVPLEEKPYGEEFKPTCEVDAHCPRPDLG